MIIRPVLAALAIALTGCAAPAESTPPPTTTRPPVPVATQAPRTSAVPATAPGCQPAPAEAVATISAAFTDPADALADTFAVSAPGGVVYVGANIVQGTRKVSSADVWIVDGPAVYALSSDARRRTTLPDGRQVASAGDNYGTKVQGCVTTAERTRNRSGGR